ncbi:signal recognition particle 19 kDa protein [Planococcus citri]|uniref:signal recognition particle 19 kDa protein n=1 Tax=Planococcus citri TaxID=170843 RepID=UPI0031F808E5
MSVATRKHSEPGRWICIYPAYINSKKTIAEGRRIAKEKSVENPTIPEIMEVLSTSGLKALPENKQYSRERSREFTVRGRVRVQIKNDDGTPCNPEFPSRESVMMYISINIPKLKSRTTNKPVEHNRETSKKKGKGRK